MLVIIFFNPVDPVRGTGIYVKVSYNFVCSCLAPANPCSGEYYYNIQKKNGNSYYNVYTSNTRNYVGQCCSGTVTILEELVSVTNTGYYKINAYSKPQDGGAVFTNSRTFRVI